MDTKIKDVCCAIKNAIFTTKCPVQNASPWSRWDYCHKFKNAAGMNIKEVILQHFIGAMEV